MEDREKVILVGLNIDKDEEDFRHSMDELSGLAEADYFDVVAVMTQNAAAANKSTYIGSGKAEELKNAVESLEVDTVIFDETLSPMMITNLSNILGIPVMDRTGLILDIFARRANTREAKLQVESARLEYMLPRLVGLRTKLGRPGGASGSMSNKGLGEKKIELDRRYIEKRKVELSKELERIRHERSTQRARRVANNEMTCALVGYTNAGKSSLMNRLLKYSDRDDSVFEEDMLFATLDTTVRKISYMNMRPFLLSDTVGFIDELPHTLVKAFRSTLEEVVYSDVLLIMIDYSDEAYKKHLSVTEETLTEIAAGDISRIYVYNKADKVIESGKEVGSNNKLPYVNGDSIYMSVKTGEGIPELIQLIETKRNENESEKTFLIPYKDGRALEEIMRTGKVQEINHKEDGTYIKVICNNAISGKYSTYIIS